MAISTSLRKSLRSIPLFRSLPPDELSAVAESLTQKQYKKGDCLWREGVSFDFIGIVQKGEIVIRHRGEIERHPIRLGSGSYFYPQGFGGGKEIAPGSAYVVDHTVLYILRLEQLSALRSKCPTLNRTLQFPPYHTRDSRLSWEKLWGVAVTILIVFLVWQDLTGVLSGILYLTADHILPFTNHSVAIELLNWAAKVDDQAQYAYEAEGYLWSQLGEKYLAIEAFTGALDNNRITAPTLNNLAVMYLGKGLNDQAVLFQQMASEVDPNEAIVKYNLGLMLLEESDHQDAIYALREATYIAPHWSLPYIHLSSIYARMGNWGDAEEAARIATHLAPARKSAHLALGLALYEQGEKQQAFSSFSRAVEIDSEGFTAKFYQALILRDLGDYDQALGYLEQSLELCDDPGQKQRIAIEIDTIHQMQQAVYRNTTQ